MVTKNHIASRNSFIESKPIVEMPRFDEHLGWTVDFMSDHGATDLDVLT